MSATLSPAEQAAITAAFEAGKVYRAARGESGLPGAYRPEAIGGGYNPGKGGWLAQSEAYRARNSFGGGRTLTQIEKVCDCCGVTFYTTRPQTKRCGEKCSAVMKRRRDDEWNRAHLRPVEVLPRECVVCGGEFNHHQSHVKYCGETCRLKAKRERQRVKENMRPATRHCMCCGSLFDAGHGNQNTCGDECRAELGRIASRRRRARERAKRVGAV